MCVDVKSLGVKEEGSSEDDSQPRTRRKVTNCASYSASDLTAAAAPSPAEPINSKSVMQSAAEIEQQLNLFRAGNPVLPEGWEYNSRGEPKAKSSLKKKSRSNVIPHHLRVKMTRIEEDSEAVPSEQQRQERLKMTRIEKEPTPDATPPTASGLGVMGGNLRKLLSNQGRQSHLDRFGIQNGREQEWKGKEKGKREREGEEKGQRQSGNYRRRNNFPQRREKCQDMCHGCKATGRRHRAKTGWTRKEGRRRGKR